MKTTFLDAMQVPELARVCCAILNPRLNTPCLGTGIRYLRMLCKQAKSIISRQIKRYELELVGESQDFFDVTKKVLNGVSLSELTLRIRLTEGANVRIHAPLLTARQTHALHDMLAVPRSGETINNKTYAEVRSILEHNVHELSSPLRTVTTLRLEICTSGRVDHGCEGGIGRHEEEPETPSILLTLLAEACPNIRVLILNGKFHRAVLLRYGASSKLKKLEISLINHGLLQFVKADMPSLTYIEFGSDLENVMSHLKIAVKDMISGDKLVTLNLGEGGFMLDEMWQYVPTTLHTLHADSDWDYGNEGAQDKLRNRLDEITFDRPPAEIRLPNLKTLKWSGDLRAIYGLMRAAPSLTILDGSLSSKCEDAMIPLWRYIAEKMAGGLKGIRACLYIEKGHAEESTFSSFMKQMPIMSDIKDLSICSSRTNVPRRGDKHMLDDVHHVFSTLEKLNAYNLYISNEALHALIHCTNMTTLTFQCCRYISTLGVVLMASHSTHIRTIRLSNCTSVEYNLGCTNAETLFSQYGQKISFEFFDDENWHD